MNALVKDRLDRLDQAINDLVASVSAYNPSPAAAVAVVEADDALDEGLVQLSQHQRNFQVLQQLRSTTDSLDSRIKTTLSSLADLRSELIKSTPLSLPSEKKAAKPVDADELLRFAQQIARPAPPAAQSGAESQPVQYQQPAVSVETSIKRESPGPPLPNAVLDSRTAEAGGLEQQTAGASHGVGTGQGRAVDALRPQFREWLEQGSRQSTELPWADQNIFVKSALNRLQEAEADTQT